MLFLPNFSENLEGDWEAKRASSELMMPELACGLFEALPVIVSWSSWEPGSRPPPPSPRAWGGSAISSGPLIGCCSIPPAMERMHEVILHTFAGLAAFPLPGRPLDALAD